MLRKEEILERTNNGLSVFKHYIPGNWRIGRNFLNPLYEDNKASCNIYFDRRDWEEQNDDHKKQEIEKMHKRNMRIKKKSMRNTLFSA